MGRRGRFALSIAGAGSLVGLVAAAVGVRTGVGPCAGGVECVEFVREMSLRVGLVAGLATVVVLFMAVGLFQMVVENEAARRIADEETAETR